MPDRMGKLPAAFVIDGETVMMATHLASAISKSELGQYVANLASDDYYIILALDTLTGAA